MSLPESSRRQLLQIARDSIHHGLHGNGALPVDPTVLPPELRERRASFVTLKTHGRLRGCMGTLEAHRALAMDVAENAYAAAFEDPRFNPLREDEEPALELHLSILSPPEPLPCADEADLLARLRPDIDGLILADGGRRATFLPSVWEDLADPREFLSHLKRKAGLETGYWSGAMRFWRYEAESVE